MRKSRLIIAAALLLGPLAANADLVRFDFTSELDPVHPNSGTAFRGFVMFDDSLLAANAVIDVNDFTQWVFRWGSDFRYSSDTDLIDPAFATFVLDAVLAVADADLCFSASGICNTSQHPVARLTEGTVFATFNAAGEQIGASGSWSGPIRVPEPGTLALLGLGLLGLAAGRKKVV